MDNCAKQARAHHDVAQAADMARPSLPLVFRGRDAVEAGVLTPSELRGPRVRRLTHGIYCPASAPNTHELHCRAAALVGDGQLVLTGRSAATVRGVDLARADDPVDVIALHGHHVNRRPGLAVRNVRIARADHEPWHEIAIASPLRIAFDVVARGALSHSVAGLDQLLRAGLVDLPSVAASLHGRHDHGIVAARHAVELADARAESPPESVLRVVLALAGMAGEPQLEVRDHRGFVARVDLGFEAERLAVEYDGEWHSDRFALTRDRERLNRLQQAGWEVLTITAPMLRRPHLVVDAVAAALARRRRSRTA